MASDECVYTGMVNPTTEGGAHLTPATKRWRGAGGRRDSKSDTRKGDTQQNPNREEAVGEFVPFKRG